MLSLQKRRKNECENKKGSFKMYHDYYKKM